MDRSHHPELPILLVEDNQRDVESFRWALEHADIKNPFVHCETKQQALAYLHQQPESSIAAETLPGLILLDLSLHGADGQELLSEIKNHKALKKIPTFVLTTSPFERDVDECYALGANAYLQKPLKLENLIELMRHLKQFWLDTAFLPAVS